MFRNNDGTAAAEWHHNMGRMVSGKDAFKGNAIRFFTAPKSDLVFGFHTQKLQIRPDKQYKFELYLKGKGEITLLVWRDAINAQGKKQHIGVVPMFSYRINSPEWKKYTGTWSVPPNKHKVFTKYEKSFIWALYVNKNSTIYVDEFKLFESDKKK